MSVFIRKPLTIGLALICVLLVALLFKMPGSGQASLHQLRQEVTRNQGAVIGRSSYGMEKPHETPQSQDVTESNAGTPKPVPMVKDTIDDSKATAYLEKYKTLFAPDVSTSTLPNPNNASSIRTWWEAAAMIDWYINSPIRYQCQNIVPYGNWHACQDKPFLVKPPCLVYSFGINFDFSFDDAMGKLGCEVHSFDPSMGKEDHQRNVNVTFHNLGLGGTNTDGFVARQDMYVKDRKVWKIRTVKRIKEMLGHENRVIDVFKMDVEGYEWAVLDNMMDTGVFEDIRQYMLEFHLFPNFPLKEDFVNSYNIYRRLREKGFREYRIGPHPKTLTNDSFNNQGDSEFVNAFFIPRDQRR